jgi:prevent-host-death family protein
MKVSATEFKAKCLSILDEVESSGNSVTITKHGRAVARLTPASPSPRPWLKLRAQKAEWVGDPLAPTVDLDDIEALK